MTTPPPYKGGRRTQRFLQRTKIREYEYPDLISCEKAAEIHRVKTVGNGYAVCGLTKVKEKK